MRPTSPAHRSHFDSRAAPQNVPRWDRTWAASDRVLLTTFTNESTRILEEQIRRRAGQIPLNVRVVPWMTFLLRDAVRPYQSFSLGAAGVVTGLNFKGERSRYTPKARPREYFLDRAGRVYRDAVADLACDANTRSGDRVIGRLERIFDHILIDELQDLSGYDLDLLDLLFLSSMRVTVVGDPRQHTFSTNRSPRNRRYSGAGVVDWLAERSDLCEVETMTESHRCVQPICDFADALYPDLAATVSLNKACDAHQGIVRVRVSDVPEYVERHRPQVLRHNKTVDTLGLPALNFGRARGRTYDRVLIFPTRAMRTYLDSRDVSRLREKEKLYVAVTRARLSVAFAV